jgi:WD40 repeat protein
MANKFLEISLTQNLLQTRFKTTEFEPKAGPNHNLEEMIEVAGSADILFIGGVGKLMQLTVSQQKVTKEYGGTMNSAIRSMV